MRALPALLATILLLGLAACHTEGPAERAGDKLDNAGTRISDTLNPPKGPAASVGRAIDRATGN